MAGVAPDGAAAADATNKDEPTMIVLKIGDESFETTPWKTLADLQHSPTCSLGRACESLTADSFVDTVEPGTVLAFKDRCSTPDKTVLARLRLLTYRLIDSSHA